MEYQNRRVEYIDKLRGYAIIIMVMGHIGFSHAFDKYIHVFHMPIWFFISGWLYKAKDQPLLGIIKKKVKTLIVPYLIWGVAQYPFWILLVKEDEQNIFEPLINYFWINTNLTMPIAGALWFLTCLFFAEIIFSIVIKKNDRSGVCGLLVLTISLVGCYFPKLCAFRLPWAIDTAFVAVGFMYIGYQFKIYENKLVVNRVLNMSWKGTIALWAGNVILSFVNGYVNLRTALYGFVPLFWFNALCAVLVYWNLAKLTENLSLNGIEKNISDRIKSIGCNSIVYLCLNQFVITCYQQLIDKIGITYIHWIIPRSIVFVLSMTTLLSIERVIMNSNIGKLFGK